MTRQVRFLVYWAVVLVTILVLVASVNVIVNPYDLFPWPRIAGINVLKPEIKNHAALTKAYQVERARPVTAVLGTSRAYLGLDSASPAWPDQYRPVYNYGLPGTTMGRSLLRELRETWSTGQLRHAVAFLDFPAFFAPDPPVSGDEDERRLRFLDNGEPNDDVLPRRIDDAFLSVFSLAALTSSATTILSQRGGDRVLDLRADGTSTDADFANAARAEGMNSVFAQKDEYDLSRVGTFQHILADWHGPMPNMNIIREMVRFCRANDITLTLVLASSHADALEIYRRAGLWPRIEQIKIELAAIVAEANSDTITAWDFLEYAPYTTEHLPPPGDRVTNLRWFWEPVHFKRALGEIMLRRIFLGTPADFGVPLTAATVDARNQAVREQQRAFIDWRLACEASREAKCASPAALPLEAARQ
jgi:hypothetical protein